MNFPLRKMFSQMSLSHLHRWNNVLNMNVVYVKVPPSLLFHKRYFSFTSKIDFDSFEL